MRENYPTLSKLKYLTVLSARVLEKTGEIQCHWVESNKSAIQTHTEAVDASVPERSQ